MRTNKKLYILIALFWLAPTLPAALLGQILSQATNITLALNLPQATSIARALNLPQATSIARALNLPQATNIAKATNLTPTLQAQEFNCAININDEQLDGTSYDYVKQTLATELASYINDYRWTDTEVLEHERINCQISIILTSASTDYTYSAEAVISARRPIYGTMQETPSIIISDQAWQFSYPEGRSLVHDELTFEALTGFIDYYAYLMLGYDFDSFAELGGSDYFAKAQDVVDLAQSSNAIGWARSSNNRRNRFTLVADMMNSSYDDLRKAYYYYHREALDGFTEDPEQAREALLETLELIQTTKRRSTSNFLFDLFFDAKSREIAAMLNDAESQIKLAAYTILSETDQAHLSDYENLQ